MQPSRSKWALDIFAATGNNGDVHSNHRAGMAPKLRTLDSKPPLLGWNLKACLQSSDRRVRLGEVRPLFWADAKDDPRTAILDILEGAAPGYGLDAKCPRSNYTDREVLLVNGSIGPHRDDGLGLTLNWLLETHFEDTYFMSEKPYLITNRGFLELEVGDVFTFDGDNTHSWVCNGSCLLAQITVRPATTTNA